MKREAEPWESGLGKAGTGHDVSRAEAAPEQCPEPQAADVDRIRWQRRSVLLSPRNTEAARNKWHSVCQGQE